MKRMGKIPKRLGAWLLTLALLVGVAPDWGLSQWAEAAETLPFSVNTVGKYIPASIGSGAYESYIMNGAISTNLAVGGTDGNQITLENKSDTDWRQNVTFLTDNRDGMPENVEDYNMWTQFGQTGSRSRSATAGFTTSSAGNVNDGSSYEGASISLGKNSGGGSWSATVTIKDNPTLKALAEAGDLQFRFSGVACGGKQKRYKWGIDDLKADYHTKVECKVYVNSDEKASVKTGTGPYTKGFSVGWTTVGVNDTIKFNVSASTKNGHSGHVVGIGNAVLLFRKASLPTVDSSGFTLNANADYRVSDTGRDQVLMDKTASMDLGISFNQLVKPALPDFTKSSEATYAFMLEFANHTLFTNSNNTGYYRQGEKAKLSLNKVGETSVSGASQQIPALDNYTKSLNFHWDGVTGYGDYYGNNPVPNTGDWLFSKDGDLSNNNYGFINKFVLASWHDMAGNPLANGTTIYTADNTGKLTGASFPSGTLTIKRGSGNAQKTVSGMANPFTYDFIIDTVPPTYSVTSNGVQPDILTGLALNGGDEYDMTVNFSEGVQVQRFTSTGALTGYQDSKVCLQFKEDSGMKATYVSGGGTQNWVFHAVVKDGTAYETSAMDLTKVIYDGNSSLTTVLTDYVGNPLQKASSTAETPSIAWAGLKVDNTPPEITITREGKKNFNVTVTDKGTYPSGLFAAPNETGGAGNAALIYYAWVKKSEQEQALKVFTDNNYAAVKRYTLTAASPDDYPISSANLGEIITLDKSAGDDEWVLMVFAPDMTWDGARQLIQYNKYKSYKNTESGAAEYYEEFMKAYGGSASGAVEYKALTSQPDDWTTNYYNYYTKSGSSYTAVPQADSYPEFVSGRVYQAGYTLLTAAPDSWSDVYTTYYVKNGDKYEHPAPVPDYPAFKENTYYVQYWLVTDATAPSDWTTGTYYELTDAGTYQELTKGGTPEFASDATYTVTFTALPTTKTKQVSVQTKNADGMPKTDSNGNAVYEFVAEADVATQAAVDATTNEPVYQLVNGNKVYQYVDENGAVIDENAVIQSAVTDATLKAGEYWVKQNPDDANNKTYERATSKAQANSRTYYTAKATAVTTQPSEWATKYGDYYLKADAEYEAVDGESAPTWAADTYYSGTPTGDGDDAVTTYTLLTAKPSDWDSNYTNYYFVAAPASYIPPSPTTVDYESGKFYKKASNASGYDPLTAQPVDWASAYSSRYYQENGGSYSLIPKNEVAFKANTYYKAAYVPVTSAPSDWNTTAASGKYSWYVGSTSTAESARTDFVTLADLPKRMLGLYDVKSGGAASSASDSTVTLVSAPAFSSGSYYKASLSVDSLFNAFTDTERRNKFTSSIMKATTNMDKMKTISSYSEFAETLGAVDRKLMQESGKYENWTISDYQKDDSNWSYKISGAVESKKPVITADSVDNDNTSNVTVHVRISEDTELSDATQYKFVTAGTEVSDDDDTAWKNLSLSSMTTVTANREYTIPLSTGGFSSSLENGSYDLYVKAKDASENAVTTKVATVTIDSGAEIVYALVLTEDGSETVIAGTEDVNMATTPRRSVDLSVKFAGKIDGGDLFTAGNFKLSWAFDANATETASASWTELTNGAEVASAQQLNGRTTKLYQIGNLGEDKETGAYYLHLRYQYVRNGQTQTQYLNKAFSLNTTAPVITLNVVSSSDTEAVVQATVSSASEIASSQYVWISGYYEQGADISGAVSGANWQNISLPGQASLQSSDEIAKQDKGNVTLVIKVADDLGNEAMKFLSFVIAGEQTPVPAPNPSISLLDVQKLSDGYYYAVVKLDMPEGQIPDAGSTYSAAIVKNGGEAVWSRWTPYESMIRIKVSDSEADLSATQLQFKFTSSTGAVTAPANYIKVSGLTYPFTSTQPWAAVSRSALQPVSMDKGVKLRFIPKTGAVVTTVTDTPEGAIASTVDNTEGYTATVNQSGLYVYNVTEGETTLPLYVSVSNIPPKTAPSWKMSFSTLETSAEPVTATLTIADGVSVDAVAFQQSDPVTVIEDGEIKEAEAELEMAAAVPSYTFYRNGTAYFKLSNVSGGTTTAKAVVDWIDAEAPELTITPDYGAYQTITDSEGKVKLANGVKLQVSADEVINVYLSTAQYENEEDQYTVGQAFTFNAPRNEEYQFNYRDRYGNSDSASYLVSNLVTALPAPDVEVGEPDADNRVTVTIRGQIPDLAIGVDGYKLYAGITTTSNEISVASDGSYTYSDTFTANGDMKGYICDNLNNTASYRFSVAGIDKRAPVVTATGSVWITQGGDFTDIDWWDYVTATDNVTLRENLTLNAALDSGAAVNTSVAGSHRVRVTVTDEAGNAGYADVYLYVVPADGMLVTDQNGVLFYSQSNKVALVKNDHIQLTVSRYQMMSYGFNQETVTNSDMTFDVYIQKSLYREGQLKYIQTVTFKEQGGESSKTIDIKPEDLDGAGYYTIIVRNSEREREFTSFFVSSSILN